MIEGIDPHPHHAVPEAHEKYSFFWEVQNRRGVPCFSRDVHSWNLLDGDLTKAVQDRTKTDYAIYVRAYDFGKYPAVYEAMEKAGAQMISLEEAEALIKAGKTIPGVPGENG